VSTHMGSLRVRRRSHLACIVAPVVAALGCGAAAVKPPAIEPSHNWCPEGFESGPGDTCFILPEHKVDAKILVYIPSIENEQNVQLEFASVRELTAQGFAVILTRGRGANCGFTQDQKQSACWPTDLETNSEAQELSTGWEKAAWQVAALLEGTDHPRHVVGYKEGATFAARLAAQALFRATAFTLVDPPATTALPPVIEGAHTAVAAITVLTGGDEPPSLRALQHAPTLHTVCKHAGGLRASEVRDAVTPPPPPTKKPTRSNEADKSGASHPSTVVCTPPATEPIATKPTAEKLPR
jgi:pimeloyl-ACP methyl ester carboxylesterase